MTTPNVAARVRERPIIMTGESVRAILAGTKAQTRRVVLPQPYFETAWGERTNNPKVIQYARTANNGGNWMWRDACFGSYSSDLFTPPIASRCPYGQPGDRLWVRENWAEVAWSVIYGNQSPPRKEIVYRAGPHTFGRDLPHGWSDANRWRSPIHMPRWASRLTLEVTNVRIERVQDITESDAKAEGCVGGATVEGYSEDNPADPYEDYAILWDALNEKRGYGWNTNPWVWVIEFRRVTP